jgi:hypothetical protein
MILRGKVAKLILNYLLQHFEGEGNFESFPISGFFKENGYYTCFDNTSYSCFVEQAKTKSLAKRWCMREIESLELYYG